VVVMSRREGRRQGGRLFFFPSFSFNASVTAFSHASFEAFLVSFSSFDDIFGVERTRSIASEVSRD
jgi:hypothetical protein